MPVELQKSLAHVRLLGAINGLELFGHARANIEVFKALRELGAEILVGIDVRAIDGDLGQCFRLNGIDTFGMPFGPQWSLMWLKRHPRLLFENPFRLLWGSWEFALKIREFKPSHIYLGSPLAYSFLALALLVVRTPLIYRMGDCPPVDSPFNLVIWKAMARRATQIVANADFVVRGIRAAYTKRKPIHLIRNFAPTARENDDFGSDIGYSIAVEKGISTILYVGAVSEHKGLLVLVEAFALLLRQWPELRLYILGQSIYDEEFRARLKARIAALEVEGNVSFAGQVGNPAAWYRAAQLHVAPSLWEEPSANVVVEAKSEGIPSVVFPSGGLVELVRHKVDGYICQDKSADSLATAIEWMLSDEARLREMGEAARRDSQIRFGRERFLDQWANVFLVEKIDGT